MIPGPILKKLCYNLYLFLLLLLLFVVKTCSDVPYDYCDKPNERCGPGIIPRFPYEPRAIAES
jgi:hypothetical protein